MVKLTEYMCNELKGAPIIIATSMDVVARGQAPTHAEVGHGFFIHPNPRSMCIQILART